MVPLERMPITKRGKNGRVEKKGVGSAAVFAKGHVNQPVSRRSHNATGGN